MYTRILIKQILYVFIMVLLFFSCSKEGNDSIPKIEISSNPVINSNNVEATSFNFTATAPWTLIITDTKAEVTWFTVDKTSGVAGTHTINITITEANPSTTEPRVGYIKISSGAATQTVTITQPVAPVIAVTGITLNKIEISMLVGENETITATVNPTNATNKNVTWSSSNTSVATVSSLGLVTAISSGTTMIAVASSDGSIIASCNVVVTAPYLSIDKTDIKVGSAQGKMNINVNSNVEWVVSNIPSWIDVSPSSGSGNSTIRLAYSHNNSSVYRSADITISSVEIQETITVTQERKESQLEDLIYEDL